jgi:DNA-binding transcriptional ArsR family regulator
MKTLRPKSPRTGLAGAGAIPGPRSPRLTSLAALGQAAECLRILAHPHRLRIVQLLLGGRFTVGELAGACEIQSHMASEHLRLMRRCGFLGVAKEGRRVYYTVAEPHLADIMRCIESRFDRTRDAVRPPSRRRTNPWSPPSPRLRSPTSAAAAKS